MAELDEQHLANGGAIDAATLAIVEHFVDESGATVIGVTGEIDLSNVDRMRAAFAPALLRTDDRLVFDLAGLEFMDSSGLAAILELVGKVSSIVLRNPSSVIRRIVESTGLADILILEP
jgi:anti-sigma B factor antagonist